MKETLLIINLIFHAGFSFSQSSSENIPVPPALDEYGQKVKAAEALFTAKEYKNSAIEYSKAFQSKGWRGLIMDKYNAAVSWTLAGATDSAFYYLNRIATQEKNPFMRYRYITADDNLKSLHSDKRWEPLLEIIKRNKEVAEANQPPRQF